MSETSLARSTIFAAVFFAVSIAIGVAAVSRDPEIGAQAIALFNEQVIGDLLSDSPPVLALKLFLNNLATCLLLFLGGPRLGWSRC